VDERGELVVAADRAAVDDRLRDAGAAGELVQPATAVRVADVDRVVLERVPLEERGGAVALGAPARDVEADAFPGHTTTIQLYCDRVVRMTLPHPLPDELGELVARRFRVIGDPTRIRLLDQLRDGEQTVNELAARLGAGQQNVSKHLAVLTDAGILARRKAGNHVHYRIADDGVLGLCEQVCGSLEQRAETLALLVAGTGSI
jgi:DNA-binding transcriptional ArsR family regulator